MANKHTSWFSFQAAIGQDDPEILIYDYIGSFGVTAKDFDAELKKLGAVTRMTVRINSPGGETPTAASIYNMMARYKDRNKTHVTVIIDGIAASSASWLAMLGDEIIMPDNSLMMIHNPSGLAYGDSEGMRRTADVLDKVKQGMVTAYASKSGKPREEVEALMTAETWYDAYEAVEAGFADKVEGEILMAAALDGIAGLDVTKFKNPPAALVAEALTASESSGVGTGQQEETPMTAKPAPANETPEQMEARLRAAITAELAAKPPVVAPVVAVAETAEQMEARLRTSITAENAAKAKTEQSIRAVCAQYGHNDKADAFITEGKSLEDVIVALVALPASKTQRQPTTAALNPHRQQPVEGQQTDGLVVPELNVTAIWAKWNAPKKAPRK